MTTTTRDQYLLLARQDARHLRAGHRVWIDLAGTGRDGERIWGLWAKHPDPMHEMPVGPETTDPTLAAEMLRAIADELGDRARWDWDVLEVVDA